MAYLALDGGVRGGLGASAAHGTRCWQRQREFDVNYSKNGAFARSRHAARRPRPRLCEKGERKRGVVIPQSASKTVSLASSDPCNR